MSQHYVGDPSPDEGGELDTGAGSLVLIKEIGAPSTGAGEIPALMQEISVLIQEIPALM